MTSCVVWFQVHVLTFTVFQLLSVLSPTLKAGDLDPCMNMLIDVRTRPPCSVAPRLERPVTRPSLQQVFNNELFGSVAEEKEVKGIVSKLMEARHSKSMDSYQLLARFCSRDSITKLLLPLKEAGLLPVSEIPPKMMTSQRATPLKND